MRPIVRMIAEVIKGREKRVMELLKNYSDQKYPGRVFDSAGQRDLNNEFNEIIQESHSIAIRELRND